MMRARGLRARDVVERGRAESRLMSEPELADRRTMLSPDLWRAGGSGGAHVHHHHLNLGILYNDCALQRCLNDIMCSSLNSISLTHWHSCDMLAQREMKETRRANCIAVIEGDTGPGI
ncbi:hypothetical protein VFPBJ_04339 [Purpureocillium lilacinum]|uniref:Uncharacterized protein n=1 Tax=Purpureocillium lilacinum TaxID=33203 RepID=A0A179GUX0_PURLI|nr:hypothetical protein VFPBJ_04339 [Purpureocillium lilacinum]